MHVCRHRPPTCLLVQATKAQNLSTKASQTPLPWTAIALFLDDTPKVDLESYPHLRGVLERFPIATYCFEFVPDTLAALLKAHFGAAYGSGSCFMKSGDHEAIILDWQQIRQCTQRLGCGLEGVAIAAFLHEYGHYLAHRAGQSNTEATAWEWARRLNGLHGFVPSQLLNDFEQLIGA